MINRTARRFFAVASILAVWSASSFAKAGENRHPKGVKFVADAVLDDAGLWTGRLAKQFSPMALDEGQKKALKETFKGPWEWSETGDYTAQGRPSALLVRGFESQEGEPTYLVQDLVLASWSEGKWRELIRLGKAGLVLGGDGAAIPADASTRGYYVTLRVARVPGAEGQPVDDAVRLWMRVVAHDAKGRSVGKKALLYFEPKLDRYEAEILKARPAKAP